MSTALRTSTAIGGRVYGAMKIDPPKKDYSSIGVEPWTPGRIPDGSYGVPTQPQASSDPFFCGLMGTCGMGDDIAAGKDPTAGRPVLGGPIGAIVDGVTGAAGDVAGAVGGAVSGIVGPWLSKGILLGLGAILIAFGIWSLMSSSARGAVRQGFREGLQG